MPKKRKLNTGGLLEGAGALAGQHLIPIPGVGAAIGGTVGKFVGGLFGGKEKTPPVPVAINAVASAGNNYLARGGMINMNKNIPGVAHKIVGPRHEQGGVPLVNGQEVEGGETMHRKMVFSDRVRVPGQSITFAKAHERLMRRGGNEGSVTKLFNLQQKTTGGGNADGKMEEGGFLESVAPYVGDILNIGRGLFSDSKVAPPTQVDRSHIALMPRQFDVSAQQAQARAGTRAITNNPNASVNTKLAAHSNFLTNSHQIQANKVNQDARFQSNIANATGQANLIDSQYQNQVRREQEAADAAKENILSEGVAGLARTYQQGKLMENQQNSDTLGFMASLSHLPEAERQSFINSIRRYLPANLQGLDFSDPQQVSQIDPSILQQLNSQFSYFKMRG